MTNRPAIPDEVRRAILIESGHRCAVCGIPLSLEIAHIIPWRESKNHTAEDLICLCANDHELADKRPGWGTKTLRAYKRNPWIQRHGGMAARSNSQSRLQLTLDLELVEFDETKQRWLQYALAAFLGITPDEVRISSIIGGSVKVELELPAGPAENLPAALHDRNSELSEYLRPFSILHWEFTSDVGVVSKSSWGLQIIRNLMSEVAEEAAPQELTETEQEPFRRD